MVPSAGTFDVDHASLGGVASSGEWHGPSPCVFDASSFVVLRVLEVEVCASVIAMVVSFPHVCIKLRASHTTQRVRVRVRVASAGELWEGQDRAEKHGCAHWPKRSKFKDRVVRGSARDSHFFLGLHYVAPSLLWRRTSPHSEGTLGTSGTEPLTHTWRQQTVQIRNFRP